MPAELIIGGISLVALSSVFEQALRAYDFFVVASRTASDDFHMVATKILIERHRFELYGQYMNLSRNGQDVPIQSQSIRDQDFISNIVQEIGSSLANSEALFEKYGISVRPGSDDIEMNRSQSERNRQTSAPLTLVEAQHTDLRASQRWRWSWTDNAKAEKLQRHLHELNNQLWSLLSPQNTAMLTRSMPSFLLPGLNDQVTLQDIGEQASQHQIHRLLQDCADLRRSVIKPDALVGKSDEWQHLVLPKESIRLTKSYTAGGTQLSVGTFTRMQESEPVLIEYKAVHPGLEPKDRALVKSRLHQLAFVLSKERSSDICLFQCAGFCEVSSHPLRYGLVYKFPSIGGSQLLDIVTLESLLADKYSYHRYMLGDRFGLAIALANALLQTHASGWYHKRIHPENIVFQKTENGQPKLSSPRLIGFGSARPSDVNEKSLGSEQSTDNIDYFCHPDYQTPSRRFEKRFDYFSLGVLLACIGPWDSLQGLVKKFHEKHPSDTKNAFAWASFLQDRVNSYLGSSCGRIYRDVVLRCLRGEDAHPLMGEVGHAQQWSEADSQRWFLFRIVHQLQRCIV
ncbi:MAG: hypothetical protein Q9167_004316 [Letrouitia subvulpina]